MIKAKIADNPYSHEKGLMFVESMANDEGMLFIWKRAQRLSFWGKNTYIPLDVAFIDAEKRIVKIGHIEPHSLKSVSSDDAVPYALEVNSGYFRENGIKVGDRCQINDPPRVSSNLPKEFGTVMILFEKEGQTSNPEKDINSQLRNFKKSQVLPLVNKPDEDVIGEPVTEQVGNAELPIIEVGQLDNILEDNQGDQQNVEPQNEVAPEQPLEEPNVTEPKKEYPVFTSAYQATEWAEQNGEVVRISYTTKHGMSLVRDVEPHGTFHAESTNREILVVFDETINDIRAFIMGNISKWAFVGKQFEKKFVVKS